MQHFWKDGQVFDFATGIADTRNSSFWLDGLPIALYHSSEDTGDFQYAYPCQDVITGTWGEVPLYPKISGYAPDTTDWISSAYSPSNDLCEVLLTGVNHPHNMNEHSLTYVYRKEIDDSVQLDLTISLYQGETLIAETGQINISYEWTTGSFELTAEQISQISNYNDLRIKLNANKV